MFLQHAVILTFGLRAWLWSAESDTRSKKYQSLFKSKSKVVRLCIFVFVTLNALWSRHTIPYPVFEVKFVFYPAARHKNCSYPSPCIDFSSIVVHLVEPMLDPVLRLLLLFSEMTYFRADEALRVRSVQSRYHLIVTSWCSDVILKQAGSYRFVTAITLSTNEGWLTAWLQECNQSFQMKGLCGNSTRGTLFQRSPIARLKWDSGAWSSYFRHKVQYILLSRDPV